MSLLLWEYYLDPVSWLPATSPTTSAGAANAGGGGYHELPFDYWDVREQAIARHMPPLVSPKPPPSDTTAPQTPNPVAEAELQAALAQSQQVILDIKKKFNDYYAQAAAVLLLDIF